MRSPHPSLPTSFFLLSLKICNCLHARTGLFNNLSFFKLKTPLMTFIYYSQEFNYPFPSNILPKIWVNA